VAAVKGDAATAVGGVVLCAELLSHNGLEIQHFLSFLLSLMVS
jgi:hypothetical protein